MNDERRDAGTGGDIEKALPEHERDDEATVGGGVMGAGGTAIDRGTETLGGPDAQGAAAGEATEERQFPPPVVDLGDDYDTEPDADEAVPPGNQGART